MALFLSASNGASTILAQQSTTGHADTTCKNSLASTAFFNPARESLLGPTLSFQSSAHELSQSPILTITNTQTVRKPAVKVDWITKRQLLLKKGVRSVKAREALRMQQEAGFVILDVRPNYEYQKARAGGSVNVEYFRLIKEWTPWDTLRRAGFAFFGVFHGTEENPTFLEDLKARGLDYDAKVVTACGLGGTTRPSRSFTQGKESRSLIAAYKLVSEGYTNVYHLEGGLTTWISEDLPMEGKQFK